MPSYQQLTPADVQHFLTHGYVTIKNCFTREQAAQYTDTLWTRLGYDPNDKTTWVRPRTHMPSQTTIEVKEFAPRAYHAICDLAGGEERVALPMRWWDGFIANLGSEEEAQTWEPPSAKVPGWHVDGDWFLHFLDTAEQGLLVIVCWSDIVPRGGGTFLAPDSIPIVARFLAQHPEGVEPNGFPFKQIAHDCREFMEVTGEVGDVMVMHPFMLHAQSQNALRAVRLITNPSVVLREPMQFDRADGNYSPVEQVVLNALGVDRFPFAPTTPRRRIVPEREIQHQKMREEEKARLAAAQATG